MRPRIAQGWKLSRARRFQNHNALELFERRQLFAAHIAGSSTIYATIQAAVNAAAPGAAVTVDPGVYSELVFVDKSMTLLGAQAGVDGRSTNRDGTSGAGESV